MGLLGPELGAVIKPYTIDRAADASARSSTRSSDQLRMSSWLHIEMGHLMALGEEVIVPALDYLFHRVEQSFDGSPTLMILDEAWLFLKHPIFASRLQDWLKTLAQEERLRRLRHAGDRRRRRLAHSPDDPQRLPDEDLPAERGGADAQDRRAPTPASASATPRSASSRRPRRSATTTTARSTAAASSPSISDRRPSPSPVCRRPPISASSTSIVATDAA